MADIRSFLAFDCGATSGRAVLATFSDGAFTMKEVYRFPSGIIELNGKYYWDILAIYDHFRKCLAGPGRGPDRFHRHRHLGRGLRLRGRRRLPRGQSPRIPRSLYGRDPRGGLPDHPAGGVVRGHGHPDPELQFHLPAGMRRRRKASPRSAWRTRSSSSRTSSPIC